MFERPDAEEIALTFTGPGGVSAPLVTTPEHPFRVASGAWVAAGRLELGDNVVTAEGELATLSAALSLQKRGTVYNFEVEGTHTYFAGDARVWVHNACKDVVISRSRHPETAAHVSDAQAAGKPSIVTIDRARAGSNRAAAQAGQPKVPGAQIDEYPPAMFREGGAGASTRPVSPADNMGAGASMGNQCRGLPCGSLVRIIVGD